MTICMKYRKAERKAIQSFGKEIVQAAAPLRLTGDVVEQADFRVVRQIVEELVYEGQGVVLTFPGMRHIRIVEHTIVAA